jgi:RNA polymerase sigma-70 factor (ECF subfamily)
MDHRRHEHGSVDPAGQRFQTTRWSLILAARDGNAVEARAALEALCGAYWYPLYAFVRRKGHDADRAQDLVQGFFTRLLEKGDLATVDRRKGKFRSYLMAACSHYLANQLDHDQARKRGGGRASFSIDWLAAKGRYELEPADNMTAERLFERQWAVTLLNHVLGRLETELKRAGKSQLFEALRPALLGAAERVPYSRIAPAVGLSEEAARAAAQRLRHRYREILREEVARTIDDPSEIDAEIRALFSALAN